jgi:hypothetical protein
MDDTTLDTVTDDDARRGCRHLRRAASGVTEDLLSKSLHRRHVRRLQRRSRLQRPSTPTWPASTAGACAASALAYH